MNALKKYVTEVVRYWNLLNLDDNKTGNTINKEIEIIEKKYKGSVDKYIEDHKFKSKLIESMYKCSVKFLYISLSIILSKGLSMVYSNYVNMEGIQMLKQYLKYFDFVNYSDTSKSKFKFAEFHGGVIKERNKILKIFNNKENRYGKNIKTILISVAGTEGLSLFNVREVHIVEPHWNEIRIEQAIGRAIRFCSHKDLPMDERKVSVLRYLSTRKTKKLTTDQHLYNLSKKKQNLVESFTDRIKEVSIDCVLNKNENMINKKFNCFKFEELTIFKNVSKAYSKNIVNDLMIHSGSNSIYTETKDVKTYKIKAVIYSSETKVVKPYNYWYDPINNIVYDYELEFPIGTLMKDSHNILKKTKDYYIIIDSASFN